jgi:hypothetical protein
MRPVAAGEDGKSEAAGGGIGIFPFVFHGYVWGVGACMQGRPVSSM